MHADDENTFVMSCICDDLELAKWLWEISGQTINIHSQNDLAFVKCAINNHLDLAKWLWKISNESINLHSHNDDAFICACKYNHVEFAKWLCELYKNYHIEILFNSIISYYIKNKNGKFSKKKK